MVWSSRGVSSISDAYLFERIHSSGSSFCRCLVFVLLMLSKQTDRESGETCWNMLPQEPSPGVLQSRPGFLSLKQPLPEKPLQRLEMCGLANDSMFQNCHKSWQAPQSSATIFTSEIIQQQCFAAKNNDLLWWSFLKMRYCLDLTMDLVMNFQLQGAAYIRYFTCCIFHYTLCIYIYTCTVQISLNSVGPESHKPRPYEAKKISCFLDWSVPTDRIRLGGSRHRSCTFIEALKFLSHVFFEASSFQRWLRNSISMHKSRKPSGRLNEAKTQGHYNKLLLRVSESVHDLASQQQLRFATSEETCGSCGMHPIKNVFI